jgi:Ribbon-helix-helix protein, copG family
MQVMQYTRIMRTTISVDDHLLEGARRRARERGQTLGQLIEDALRRELAPRDESVAPEVPVFRGKGGLRPGIDPTSNRSLWEALDEGVEFPHRR